MIPPNTQGQVCSFDALYDAMILCRKGVMWKDSVARFSNNGLRSILQLQRSLLEGSYTLAPYTHFTIYEPKKRHIVSTKFKDRVFQRSLVDNHLYAPLTKGFVYDNLACQIGKGTDKARHRLVRHLQHHHREWGQEGYILSCDLKDFFGSTPHSLAKEEVFKRVADPWARQHVVRIIDSYNFNGSERGLGLGSQVTQLIQLAILDSMDHMIKEQLGIKHYLRYMDDFVLIHPDKSYLKECLRAIERHLSEKGLQLHPTKTQIFPVKQGLVFLGVRFALTETSKVIKTLPRKNIQRRRRKIRKYAGLVAQGRMTSTHMRKCFVSWRAHARKTHSYGAIQQLEAYYKEVTDDQAH